MFPPEAQSFQCPGIGLRVEGEPSPLWAVNNPPLTLWKHIDCSPKWALPGWNTTHVRSCLNSSERETRLKSCGVLMAIEGCLQAMFLHSQLQEYDFQTFKYSSDLDWEEISHEGASNKCASRYRPIHSYSSVLPWFGAFHSRRRSVPRV